MAAERGRGGGIVLDVKALRVVATAEIAAAGRVEVAAAAVESAGTASR